MDEKFEIKNYMEKMVKKNLESQLETRNDICKCDRCKLDVMAYSLNHLPPKYVVTDKGSIYTRLQELEVQMNADITREFFKAIEIVNINKRHR